MKRVLSVALVAVLAVPLTLHGQGKPNFSGTWTLDPAKSDPAPARGGGGGGRGGGGRGGGRGAGGPVTIAQTAADITIGMATYKLDGSETTISGGRGGDAKAKAEWQGNNLVITTTRDIQGTTITMKDVRSLSADGAVMTVESTTTGMPQGGGTRKTVYNKS